MSNLTPEAEHEMDLIRRRSKAYGESINPKQPSLDEMVDEEVTSCQEAVKELQVHLMMYPGDRNAVTKLRYVERSLNIRLALQDVLGLITKGNYYGDLEAIYQAISSRLEVE